MKCEETYMLDIKDLIRWWFFRLKLRCGDSILKFVLKTIQIYLKCVRQKNAIEKNLVLEDSGALDWVVVKIT